MVGGAPAPLGSSAPEAGFRFKLVGPFEAWRDGVRLEPRELGSRKGRTLLKVLLLAPDEPVLVDRIADIVWAGSPPDRPDRSVATLVSRLRALLGSEAIEGGSGVYRLRPGDRFEIDLVEAERLAAEARHRLAAAEPALAWTAAQRALALVGQHDLLEDEPASDWADPARSSLVALRAELRRRGYEAALALSDPDPAAELATAALEADPLDEAACRALMRAHHLRGDTAAALLAYDRLRTVLADELGVDPAARTRDLHLAMLRGDPLSNPRGALPPSPDRSSATRWFVGRDAELARIARQWMAATEGHPSLLLIAGEAGIGKTRLAEEALDAVQDTGGLVVRARCYEAERSLFLGPVVDAVASIARHLPPQHLREDVDPWAGTLAELVPDIGHVLRPLDYTPSSPDIERRRTFDAVVTLLRNVSARRPLLLFLDDLHNAGSSTGELLHYLIRHAATSRLLVLATVRIEEGHEPLRELAPVSERLDVGPLTPAAVSALARTFGASAHLDRIVTRTRGHTLAVIETLEAIAEADTALDEPPVPESLRAAVLGRLERAGSDVEELLRAAATLGTTFELSVLARLLDLGIEETARRAGKAAVARLLVEDGPLFAFSNDLVRDIVYDSTPQPTRVARHRRAASLLAGNPEAVAIHATAAGDWSRAVDAWLEAADLAARRYANRDAERLLEHALQAAEAANDLVGAARARLARAGAREALADYSGALDDLERAAELSRAVGRPELEAAALRALGGDVIVGLGRPSAECLPYVEAGLRVAQTAQLGSLEVELLARLAILWTNRARFDLASAVAEQALARARDLDDDRAVTLALDGVKNVSAYMGAIDRLEGLLPELERRLQEQGDLELLQWAAFESGVPSLARGRWGAAVMAIDRALALNHRTGHVYGSLFIAHRSWIDRARGHYGSAIEHARRAADEAGQAGHPWWIAFAGVVLGWVLSDVGAHDEAVERLEVGVAAAERDGMEAYLVRGVCHLALARWRRGDHDPAERDLLRAEELLAGVTAPPGLAFLHGAHAYAAVARVRLERGEVADVERLLDVVRDPAVALGWCEVVAVDRVLRGRCRLMTDDAVAARRLFEEAVARADATDLAPLAWEAHAGLAHAARRLGDASAAADHLQAAAARRDAIAASIGDPVLRREFVLAARRHEDAPPVPIR